MDLNPLFEELKKHQITIYSIGTNTNKLYEMSIKNSISCIKCNTLLIACDKIKEQIEKIKSKKTIVVLLSPAASSFDQFDSYKQRGQIFKNNIV